MKLEHSKPGVYVTSEEVIVVTQEILHSLRKEAPTSIRRRVRFCAHPDDRAPVQEMIVAMDRDTYVAPHAHPGKSESFHVIEGEANVVLFDESGSISRVVPMGPAASGKAFYYRINTPLLHTVVVESDLFIFHETTSGPFVEGDATVPPWAPPEDDRAAGLEYVANLRSMIAAYLARQRRG